MPANFVPPSGVEYIRVLPEIILAAVATLIMVLEPLTPAPRKRALGYLALAGFAGALAGAAAAGWRTGPAFSGMLEVDGFATFFRLLVILAGLLVTLVSFPYLRREEAESGEYYALLLYSVAGQTIMVSAADLIVLFIGLEISSIASYVLAGYMRREKLANEAAAKYFLLGSFATAFLLYGIALIYGATGTTRLNGIAQVLSDPRMAPAGILTGTAVALMLVGFAFKISAAPFQVWAPDVYQGAPSPVAAFLAAGPKAAAFAVLLRVFMTAFAPLTGRWLAIMWSLSLLTMIVGNFAALLQTNIKRLLAYSSIAHAGYVLVAVTAHSEEGVQAAMFYLTVYVFMNIGAFAVVAYFSRKGERYVEIEDLAGLGVRQPVLAALFAVILLSLIGVPPTAGFLGKFYIFQAAVKADLLWLTVLGLLNSAVAAYYYLRLIVIMYMKEPGDSLLELPGMAVSTRAALWTSAAAVVVLGLFPALIR
ncbi:MAG TPA: NADH-quinone oxidoreductase subunit N [Bryobacteraceae bacterium]|nr:NADH-quinone oxidoreductase subunit N [Bryobacteraceae bacterium]HPQ17139.1 NADH-quinone oxidoreductase subunit N [Bryobacteraceae bacterium]HPU71956.1 NADH-quinone oxidoreductase subunit N [Bryobacteraceae bacterium]